MTENTAQDIDYRVEKAKEKHLDLDLTLGPGFEIPISDLALELGCRIPPITEVLSTKPHQSLNLPQNQTTKTH